MTGTNPLRSGDSGGTHFRYAYLDRLERDGLVAQDGDPDTEGRIAYRITGPGRQEVTSWFASPVTRQGAPRDELAIKLALAVTTPGVDVLSVVQTQRTATMTGTAGPDPAEGPRGRPGRAG